MYNSYISLSLSIYIYREIHEGERAAGYLAGTPPKQARGINIIVTIFIILLLLNMK